MTYELLSRSAHDTGLDDESVQCIVTSPPYWGLRKYDGEQEVAWPSVSYSPMPDLAEVNVPSMSCGLGSEKTLVQYVAHVVEVFREMWRLLCGDGVAWLVLGDTYASAWSVSRRNVVGSGSLPDGTRKNRPNRLVDGLKEKDLCGIPWRVAFALQADGWYLRNDVIWSKSNPTPEGSVRDRSTRSHEYVFLLAKSERYYYEAKAVREPSVNGSTRNRRTIWHTATQPYKGAHFATYPPKLIEPMILAGSRRGDTVLDPFSGSGTTGVVALKHGRNYIGVDINDEYNKELAEKRLANVQMGLI